jgi:hypothetical protein
MDVPESQRVDALQKYEGNTRSDVEQDVEQRENQIENQNSERGKILHPFSLIFEDCSALYLSLHIGVP